MKTKAAIGFIALLSLLSVQTQAGLLGTAFTYQGQLVDGGLPATGSYDLQFTLYDSTNVPGTLVAGPVTNAVLNVTDGLFTTTLDFGSGIFDGNARWLEIAVRTNGGGNFTTLTPRQPLTPAPAAMYATTAASASVAALASSVGSGGVSAAAIRPGAVTSGSIADGSITTADLSSSLASNTFWRLDGNAGTTGSQFLGTTGNQPLELKVNNSRVLRLEPGADGEPNLVGGADANLITSGVKGATIAGGGNISGGPNRISAGAHYASIGGGHANTAGAGEATVGGGANNTASGTKSAVGGGSLNRATHFASAVFGGYNNAAAASYGFVGGGYGNTNGGEYGAVGGGLANWATGEASTVPGGAENAATGSFSLAAGRRAKAFHSGTFVWADTTDPVFISTATNQFLIRAGRGVGINTNNPQSALHVNGTVTASNFAGSGSMLTSLSGGALVNGSVTSAQLAAGSVGSTQLALGAVTTAGLADGAVTAAKMSTSSNWLTFKITKPGAAGWEEFGKAIAPVDANFVLAGAPRDNIGAEQAGAAYLFTAGGKTVTTFANPTPADGDLFGASVAALGSHLIVIGAPGDDGVASNSGRAYLFSTNGILWTTLASPSPAAGDSFGTSVASLGTDRVLIGCPGKEATGNYVTNYGVVYLFNTNGILLNTFTNPISGQDCEFGREVVAVGNAGVLISAAYNWMERVYLFSTNGTLMRTFTKPMSSGSGSLFGYSIAAVGDNRVLIGAVNGDEGGYDTGTAYLFHTNGNLITTFTNPTPVYNDHFGCSVAAAGSDRVVIGAIQDNTAGTGAGAAYVFSTNGILVATIIRTPVTGGWFGSTVAALGPEQVIVGTYADNSEGPWAGAVYVCTPDALPFAPGLIAEGVRGGSIATPSLANGAVTSDKIAEAAVGSAELGNDAGSLTKVTGGKLSVDSGKLNLHDSLYLNDRDVYLRGDSNHGLGWYGSGKLFDNVNVNGPALYGNSGGVLGWRNGGTDHAVLAWNNSGIVNIGNAAASHLTLDDNELQARSGAGTAPLYLNRIGGNVSIGASSPSAKLDVTGDTRVRGLLRIGSETGTTEIPSPAGLVVRRINSINQSANQVLAAVRLLEGSVITLERDGTSGGFLIRYPAVGGGYNLTIACTGMDASGNSRNFYSALPAPAAAGTLQIYANALNIVHFQCSFGDTYNSTALTQVTLSRYGSDNYWSGTLVSTYNQ